MTPTRPHSRVESVDCLRGIAVGMVVLMHLFVGANSGLKGGQIIEPVLRYGWLGVDVFFVISGFIIPFSLHRSGYQIGQFGRFLLKRIIRLDPPYLLRACLKSRCEI